MIWLLSEHLCQEPAHSYCEISLVKEKEQTTLALLFFSKNNTIGSKNATNRLIFTLKDELCMTPENYMYIIIAAATHLPINKPA